jgi:Domain of unknown function (DUF5658)
VVKGLINCGELPHLLFLSASEGKLGVGHLDAEGQMTQPRRRRRPASRAYWVWLVLFVALQVADVVSTNYALTIPGVWEANPLMALSQAKLGAAWWLPKLAVAGCLCFAAYFLRRRWPILFAVSISGVAVLGNLTHL